MKSTIKIALAGMLLVSSTASFSSSASDDADMDRSHPKAFVKDSVITSKIKSQLAAAHLTSAARIHVDTDANGVVWLTGTARNQAEIDKAVAIARDTKNVVSVKSDLTIKIDD